MNAEIDQAKHEESKNVLQDLKAWCTVAEKIAPLVRKAIEAFEEVFGGKINGKL